MAAIPKTRACRRGGKAAQAHCDRSLFDVSPCRRRRCGPRTCRPWSAFAAARTMTLSHTHQTPRKPSRVVVLGSGGFLGRNLLAACAVSRIEAVGLGSRDI